MERPVEPFRGDLPSPQGRFEPKEPLEALALPVVSAFVVTLTPASPSSSIATAPLPSTSVPTELHDVSDDDVASSTPSLSSDKDEESEDVALLLQEAEEVVLQTKGGAREWPLTLSKRAPAVRGDDQRALLLQVVAMKEEVRSRHIEELCNKYDVMELKAEQLAEVEKVVDTAVNQYLRKNMDLSLDFIETNIVMTEEKEEYATVVTQILNFFDENLCVLDFELLESFWAEEPLDEMNAFVALAAQEIFQAIFVARQCPVLACSASGEPFFVDETVARLFGLREDLKRDFTLTALAYHTECDELLEQLVSLTKHFYRFRMNAFEREKLNIAAFVANNGVERKSPAYHLLHVVYMLFISLSEFLEENLESIKEWMDHLNHLEDDESSEELSEDEGDEDVFRTQFSPPKKARTTRSQRKGDNEYEVGMDVYDKDDEDAAESGEDDAHERAPARADRAEKKSTPKATPKQSSAKKMSTSSTPQAYNLVPSPTPFFGQSSAPSSPTLSPSTSSGAPSTLYAIQAPKFRSLSALSKELQKCYTIPRAYLFNALRAGDVRALVLHDPQIPLPPEFTSVVLETVIAGDRRRVTVVHAASHADALLDVPFGILAAFLGDYQPATAGDLLALADVLITAPRSALCGFVAWSKMRYGEALDLLQNGELKPLATSFPLIEKRETTEGSRATLLSDLVEEFYLEAFGAHPKAREFLSDPKKAYLSEYTAARTQLKRYKDLYVVPGPLLPDALAHVMFPI